MTQGSDHRPIEEMLEEYCDGQLDSTQRSQFEQTMRDDPSLHEQVELQSQIDAVLRNRFDERQMVDSRKTPTVTTIPMRQRLSDRPIWKIAAALFFVVSMGVVYRQYTQEFQTDTTNNGRTMQAYYNNAIASGFKPGWACETDEQFKDTFQYRFGQPMLATVLPAGVELLGLGYGRILTANTLTVFARVDGKPVMLFVEPTSASRKPAPLEAGMNRFHRELGRVVIYEISLLNKPHILDHFYIVDRNADGG